MTDLYADVRERIRSYWHQRALSFGTRYGATGFGGILSQAEVQFVASRLPRQPGRVLDNGCGNGRVIHALLRRGNGFENQFYGIDNATGMIVTAVEWLGSRARFLLGDLLGLPYERECFDMVYTVRALQNLPSSDLQKEALLEIARVIKPGGIAVIIETTHEGLNDLDRRRVRIKLEPEKVPWHNTPLLEQEVCRWIEEKANMSVEGTYYYPLCNVSNYLVRPFIVDAISRLPLPERHILRRAAFVFFYQAMKLFEVPLPLVDSHILRNRPLFGFRGKLTFFVFRKER